MECRRTDEAVQKVVQRVISYCDGMTFLTTSFATCMQKLDSKNSECWSTHVPVLDSSCSNVFGRDGCLKAEIIETCGERDWFGFRENMLNLMVAAFPTCNIDQYANI